jgi:polyvinyl alcohol dehydrogenase (cytochrome)
MTRAARWRGVVCLAAALGPTRALAASGGPASASGPARTGQPASAWAAAATAPAAARAPAPAAAQSWPVAGQNIANTRDQAAETVISPGNAAQLASAWTLATAGDVTATPTMVNNVLYFPDMGGMLWAVTSTGHVVWSNPVSSYTGITGDVSRDSPAIDGDELITGDGWDDNTSSR